LCDNNEAENGEPQLQNKFGAKYARFKVAIAVESELQRISKILLLFGGFRD